MYVFAKCISLFISGHSVSYHSYTNDTFQYPSRSRQQQLHYQTASTENFDDYNSNGNEKEVVNNALNRGPYFDISASRNVTALLGKTAYLNCRIRNLGNKTVSTNIFHEKYIYYMVRACAFIENDVEL